MTWVVRAIRSNGGVARLRSVTFSSSTMHDRDEIWVAKGRRRAGDGDGPDSPGRLTKNRTLPQTAQGASPKTAVWLVRGSQNAPFREDPCPECAFPSRRGAREVWGNPPARLRGTMENVSTGQMRSSNPPPGCGVGCAGVRKSRLGVWSHGKAHSEALWPSHLTKNRTLQPVPHQKPQFGWSEARRTRLSVRTRAQNALFRDVPCPECAFP